MIRPLQMPLKRGDSFESHVSIEVHFSGTEEMSDIRHSAEIQFGTLKIAGSGKAHCSLFVDGIVKENEQRSFNMRSYIVLSDGKFYSARSSMTDLRRADLHRALGELTEDLRMQLNHKNRRDDASVSMDLSDAELLPA